jgi:hypothetical protein
MTFSDEIAALNAYTRTAFREVIDRGLANDVSSTDIASAVHGLVLFEHDLVPPVDPVLELGKAVLALADRPSIVQVTMPEQVPTVVNVPAPVVNVSVPEQPAPIVKAVIPTELRITSMPDRVTRRLVKRDKAGAIIETSDVETDG